ncbi:hypothetical protein [Cystobacter fuscus]|uniref:hypothetical protein n=1 Tax=Cystobacter fuscus TaxID=43 RepID=UPI002B2C483E|nr:hypothetical protein F0U63_10110 [Cystobacter fuscus]
MSGTIQTIRTQAQELLALAHVDPAFNQMLQKQPDLALAGLPEGVTCSTDDGWNCSWTCRIITFW